MVTSQPSSTWRHQKGLIAAIESETSGNFQTILVLESTEPQADPDYEGDCNNLKEAIEGIGTDKDALIRAIAGKTPGQIEVLKAKFQELHGRDLVEWIDDETFDLGAGVFTAGNFRATLLGLLRPPLDQLANSVRDCILGFDTNDTGLITGLVHLSERKRRELVRKSQEIKSGGDLYAHIEGGTSGNYKRALLALVKPPPVVLAEALAGSMAGVGTSDDLLINWMLFAKDRMDEVREAFLNQHGKELKEWIDVDCSGDYKDTLMRCASRKCYKFMGNEVGLQCSPPRSRGEAIIRFSKTLNRCCRKKWQNPDANLRPTEVEQQEMSCAFLHFSGLSSCAPNLDGAAVWELTTACGPQFAPQDDGPDLDATFIEWDYTGSRRNHLE